MAEPARIAGLEVGTLAQWVGAVATSGAVLYALFRDAFQHWFLKPKLTVYTELKPPHCQQTTAIVNSGGFTCYYLRLWVQNRGRSTAKRVQVYVAGLSRRQADGSLRRVDTFLPMNLRWAHGQPQGSNPEIFAKGIAQGMGKHCDLGHLLDPRALHLVGERPPGVPEGEAVLALDLEVRPSTMSHVIPKGAYELRLRVGAANCKPVEKVLEITLAGDWFPDETKMFSDGLGLRILD